MKIVTMPTMLDTQTYFIKDGYRHKSENTTLDSNRSDHYWSEEKAALSRFYQRGVYQYAASLVKKHQLKSVLDVGCGPGYKLMEVVHPVCPDVLGIDQEGAVHFARGKFGNEFFVADDIEHPSYSADKKYDLIICSDVIEHMKDPDLLLSYITRFAAPSSYILFSTPERDILRGKDNMSSPNKDHVREWNGEELQTYLKDRGFTIIESRLFEDLAFNWSKFYFSEKLKHLGRGKSCQTVLVKFNRV